jgi:tetratricopeptide (TPR) repeat protein
MNTAHLKHCVYSSLYTSLVFCTLVSIGFLAGCTTGSSDNKFEAKIESAKKYLSEEKYQEARIELQTAIDLKPLEAEGYYQLAEVMLRLGDFSKALENYTSAINYNPDHTLARLHLASLQIIAKQYEYAESNIQHVLDRDPNNKDALVLKANMTFVGPRKNSVMAREILQGVLSRNPDFVPALGSIGHIEIADENLDLAEEYFLKAKKNDPGNKAIQVALTDLYARQGRLHETEESLTELVASNPEHTGFRYVLGEFFLKKGLSDNAIEQYREVLSNNPGVHDARDRLYEIFSARNQPEKSKALTAELEKLQPNNELLPYFKGRDELLDGNFTKALEYFREAIVNAPNFAPAFKSAGVLELATGQVKEGIAHLEQALNIDPNNVEARFALARIKLTLNEIESSRLHINKILEQYPKHLSANIIRADIALLEDDFPRAEKVYSFLRENYPDIPVGFFKSGLLEERRENCEKAISYYKKTLSFDIDTIQPGKRMALCMSKMGTPSMDIVTELQRLKDSSQKTKAEYDMLIGSVIASDPNVPNRFEQAKRYFTSAIENNPNLIGAYFALGGIDSVTGNLDDAVENYNKLLLQSPNHIPTRMLLALTLEQKGNYEEAISHYGKILEVNPRFGPAANNKAFLLVEEVADGDLNEALRLAQIAKEELPRESSVADTLGWVHHKKGNHRAALTLLQEAYELSKEHNPEAPVNPEILYHLAVVKHALNDVTSAKKLIREAIKTGGENHPKHAHMKKLDSLLK